MRISAPLGWSFGILFATILAACSPTSGAPVPSARVTGATPPAPLVAGTSPATGCRATAPVWLKPPEDAAIPDPPAFDYYFANQDRSILASAWWVGENIPYLRVNEEGMKIGWFRPAGAALEITGRRLDGAAPPLGAQVPEGYPSRFQASDLHFPTAGCWEVTAKAANSQLVFVVWVEPASAA
jgi:hypothetical protein